VLLNKPFILLLFLPPNRPKPNFALGPVFFVSRSKAQRAALGSGRIGLGTCSFFRSLAYTISSTIISARKAKGDHCDCTKASCDHLACFIEEGGGSLCGSASCHPLDDDLVISASSRSMGIRQIKFVEQD